MAGCARNSKTCFVASYIWMVIKLLSSYRPFYQRELTSIPALISYHTLIILWDTIIYPLKFGMDIYFHPTFYNGCNFLFRYGSTLSHVSKMDPMIRLFTWDNITENAFIAISKMCFAICILESVVTFSIGQFVKPAPCVTMAGTVNHLQRNDQSLVISKIQFVIWSDMPCQAFTLYSQHGHIGTDNYSLLM